MDDEQLTPEQKERMRALFEQAARNDYPNPERIGCPGSAFLKTLATDRKSIPLTDPSIIHVARCSPCFDEFAAYRESARRQRFKRRTFMSIAGAVAALGTVSVGLKLSQNHSGQSGVYKQLTIDLQDKGIQRGYETRQPSSGKPSLPRDRLNLQIILPFASAEGDYEVQILRRNHEPTGLKASGHAGLREGRTILRVRIDLSTLPPEAYELGIRRVPFDWLPIPVQVR